MNTNYKVLSSELITETENHIDILLQSEIDELNEIKNIREIIMELKKEDMIYFTSN